MNDASADFRGDRSVFAFMSTGRFPWDGGRILAPHRHPILVIGDTIFEVFAAQNYF